MTGFQTSLLLTSTFFVERLSSTPGPPSDFLTRLYLLSFLLVKEVNRTLDLLGLTYIVPFCRSKIYRHLPLKYLWLVLTLYSESSVLNYCEFVFTIVYNLKLSSFFSTSVQEETRHNGHLRKLSLLVF